MAGLLSAATFWELQISYWPDAVVGGVNGFVPPNEGKADHSAFEFYFQHPPTREDFLQVCRQLPWCSVWDQTLLPIVNNNDWPMMDMTRKASSVELKNADGILVGTLRVTKQVAYENQNGMANYISSSELDRALKGMKGNDVIKAREVLRDKNNYILEQSQKLGPANFPENRLRIMQAVLHYAGLRKSKPRPLLK